MTLFSPYRKRREILVIGIEAKPGVVATKKYAMRWLEKSFRSIPSILENESAMGLDSKINDSDIDVWHSEGSIGGKVTELGFGYLLNGMLNKVTTVDNEDGTFTHTFERDMNAARKTFSVWDVRPVGTRLFTAQHMDNLNLSIEVGDAGAWLETSAAFKGWKHSDESAFTPPAFAADEKEFTSRMVTIRLADDLAGLSGAASRVKAKSIEFNMEEGTSPAHYVGEMDNDPEFDSDPAEVKGSMVVKYRTTDFEEAYFVNKKHAMSITAQNGDEKIEIIGTQVRFRELTDSDGRDETVSQTISYYFEPNLSEGGKDVIVKVTNREASFSA